MSQTTTNFKKKIYDTLVNDATLIALLGGANVWHYKKPATNPTATRCVIFNLLPAGALIYERKLDEVEILFTIQAEDPDNNDKAYERVYELLQDKRFQEGDCGCHRLRLDWKSPDELLADQITWQMSARFFATIERK
jgi:hypothetical protein